MVERDPRRVDLRRAIEAEGVKPQRDAVARAPRGRRFGLDREQLRDCALGGCRFWTASRSGTCVSMPAQDAAPRIVAVSCWRKRAVVLRLSALASSRARCT